MDAAIRGGFRVVEFTMTTPGALELVREYSSQDAVVVGAGTVLTVEQAENAVRAGARFLVSPVVDEAVILAAESLGVAVIPGAHTPTEMLRAHDVGAPLLKLFPAPAGGPTWLRALLGPLPFLRVVPTNGVSADNAGEWLAAGAYAVGFASALFDPSYLAVRNFDSVEEMAGRILARVRAAPR
jgi:Entner-Doudoroff aldolase